MSSSASPSSAGTYLYQEQRLSSLGAAETAATRRLVTRYAAALKERQRADARRDTLLRRMNLIRAIDEDRFIWPHVLDEVSKALPPYTWLSLARVHGHAARLR